jgi:threonine synthase
MKFVDTRTGKDLEIDSFKAVLEGKVSEGLIVMQDFPKAFTADEIQSFFDVTFTDLAIEVLSRFFSDISKEKIVEFCHKAYDKDCFDPDKEVLPVVHIKDDIFCIEQWHGKTAAFKDIPLSVLPYFISEALDIENQKTGKKEKILLLGATSGDTGSAGQAGFYNIKDAFVAILYPEKGKVSYIQKQQMINFQSDDGRICAYSVLDNFDYCQNKVVKPLLEDNEFKKSLKEKYSVRVSSLNSINIGRIGPQVVSSFQAYRKIAPYIGDRSFDICVPTGNFGHILSAYFAKKMGIPIRKMIIATNANDVLYRFIATGVYEPKEFKTTISPSMDIAVSSNLERLLYYLQGAEKTKKYMEDLSRDGFFKADDELMSILKEEFAANFASEEETKAQIKKTWKNQKRLLDPHSAVAMCVAEKEKEPNTPMVFCETAHWSKFTQTIHDILNPESQKEDGAWSIDYIDELDAELEKIEARPRATYFMKSLNTGNKSPKMQGIKPTSEEMKEILYKQIKEALG